MLSRNEIIHNTDYSFQKYCNDNFGINRGVYNTIESWFFTKGIKNITLRREIILHFLEYIANDKYHQEQTKIKFGSGRLVINLNEYWCQDSVQIY